jgi:hypothetical protein
MPLTACLLMALLSVAPPNFSGSWRLDEARSNTEGSGGWFGDVIKITQDDKRITFASGGEGVGSGSTTYALGPGATGTKRELPGGGTRTDAARWDGSRLLLTTTFVYAQPASNSRRTITVMLDNAGALIVDVTQEPESAGGRFARHSVYVKQPAHLVR